MTGDIEKPDTENQVDEEVSADEISDEDIVLSTDDDDLNVGSTAEINVEKLVAKIDATDSDEAARQREVRLKLEAVNEQRDDEFGKTYNFDIDEDG